MYFDTYILELGVSSHFFFHLPSCTQNHLSPERCRTSLNPRPAASFHPPPNAADHRPFLSSLCLITVLGVNLCPDGSFNRNGTCTPCSRGTYRSISRNDSVCFPCPSGTKGVQEGGIYSSLACIECQPGYFASESASTQCLPCPAGTRSAYGYKTCVACPLGSSVIPDWYGRGYDRTEACEKCPIGYFHDGGPELTCKLCPRGTIADKEGSAKCQKCPPGTFELTEKYSYLIATTVQRTRCEKCAAGTFSDTKSSTSCKICPAGTFSEAGATRCTPCPAGKFAPTIAAESCKKCPPRTTSLGLRPAACKHSTRGCTFDTFESDDGECEKCVPGQRYNPSMNRCEPCENNQVSPGGISTECRTCPSGQVPSQGYDMVDGLTCVCKLGTRRLGSTCIPCAAGTFGNVNSKTSTGYWSRGAGSTFIALTRGEPFCTGCAGFTTSAPGSTECKQCKAGFYYVSSKCLPCPKGYNSRLTSLNALFSPRLCFSEMTGCPMGYGRRLSSNGDKCIFERSPRGALQRGRYAKFDFSIRM